MMQEGDGAFRMSCGLHNGAGVVLQDLDPARDIAGMIRARLQGNAKVGGKECRAKLCTQFFAGVSFITPFLAAKAAIKTAFMAGPMHGFMAPCGVISMGIMESREGRKLDAVG